jgi:hypothetical protein
MGRKRACQFFTSRFKSSYNRKIPVLFFNGEYFLQRIGIYEAGFSFKPENIVPIE